MPLVIEKGNRTFDKLKLLPKLPELLDSNSTVLNNLQSVKQARKIGFDDAIKNQDKDLLLALQSFGDCKIVCVRMNDSLNLFL